MKFVQAQFSLKYELFPKIRRYANDIEDYLSEFYGAPQTTPIPDEIAPEAPRIILYSKNGHSQINFSQIAVDFIIRFDGSFCHDFKETEKYIKERIALLEGLLKQIGISSFCFCGITYNARLDIETSTPIEYIEKLLGDRFPKEDLYEASQRTAVVRDKEYFINEQVGTYKEFRGKNGAIPDLIEIDEQSIISEGVTLSVDINNRYQYMHTGKYSNMELLNKYVDKIYLMIAESLDRWE